MCLFFVADRTSLFFSFFFFNDTATTEIYTLSLHDALPILPFEELARLFGESSVEIVTEEVGDLPTRSEEHTSELQSPCNLVCRLLLEKKKKNTRNTKTTQSMRHGSRRRIITEQITVYCD